MPRCLSKVGAAMQRVVRSRPNVLTRQARAQRARNQGGMRESSQSLESGRLVCLPGRKRTALSDRRQNDASPSFSGAYHYLRLSRSVFRRPIAATGMTGAVREPSFRGISELVSDLLMRWPKGMVPAADACTLLRILLASSLARRDCGSPSAVRSRTLGLGAQLGAPKIRASDAVLRLRFRTPAGHASTGSSRRCFAAGLSTAMSTTSMQARELAVTEPDLATRLIFP